MYGKRFGRESCNVVIWFGTSLYSGGGDVILPNSHTWTFTTHPQLYVKVQTMTFANTAARTVPVRSLECFSSFYYSLFSTISKLCVAKQE